MKILGMNQNRIHDMKDLKKQKREKRIHVF